MTPSEHWFSNISYTTYIYCSDILLDTFHFVYVWLVCVCVSISFFFVHHFIRWSFFLDKWLLLNVYTRNLSKIRLIFVANSTPRTMNIVHACRREKYPLNPMIYTKESRQTYQCRMFIALTKKANITEILLFLSTWDEFWKTINKNSNAHITKALWDKQWHYHLFQPRWSVKKQKKN